GPAVLGKLPQPRKMDVDEITALAKEKGNAVVDTRNKQEFMRAHIKGSLLSPFNKQFNTIAGSYISEDDTIYLIIDEEDVEEAVRDLIRIGLDRIEGYITPADLETFQQKGGSLESIETIDFDKTAELLNDDENRILDVRRVTEF